MTTEKLNKMHVCSHLLPDPGGEVVRECLDEINRAVEMLHHVVLRLETGQSDLQFYDDWEEYVEDMIGEIKDYLSETLTNTQDEEEG